MFETRIMKLQKFYDLNANRILDFCDDSINTYELEKLYSTIRKFCLITKMLCKEISNSNEHADLFRKALKLDRTWMDLLMSVETAYIRSIRKAA